MPPKLDERYTTRRTPKVFVEMPTPRTRLPLVSGPFYFSSSLSFYLVRAGRILAVSHLRTEIRERERERLLVFGSEPSTLGIVKNRTNEIEIVESRPKDFDRELATSSS